MSRFSMNPALLPCASLLSRRDVLRVGSLSIGASLLPYGWASAKETSTDAESGLNAKADSVIFLWMGGGVTHIDSFDPKPHAPEEIRGTLGTISTSLPGVHFGEPMSQLARIATGLLSQREVCESQPGGARGFIPERSHAAGRIVGHSLKLPHFVATTTR